MKTYNIRPFGSWVRILLPFVTIFFLSNCRDLRFHEHFQFEIASKCDIKAENSSTLCKLHEGRKGLRPMGSNADLFALCKVLQYNIGLDSTQWTPNTRTPDSNH